MVPIGLLVSFKNVAIEQLIAQAGIVANLIVVMLAYINSYGASNNYYHDAE